MNQELGTRRITHHPILGEQPEAKVIKFTYDGRELPAFEGEPILAALAAQGIRLSRTTSRRGEKRWFFCGTGLCTDCMMIVDGVPNVRTCVTPVREGTQVQTQRGVGVWEEDPGHD